MSYDVFFYHNKHNADEETISDLLEREDDMFTDDSVQLVAECRMSEVFEQAFAPLERHMGNAQQSPASLVIMGGVIALEISYNESIGPTQEVAACTARFIAHMTSKHPLHCYDPQLDRFHGSQPSVSDIASTYQAGRNMVPPDQRGMPTGPKRKWWEFWK